MPLFAIGNICSSFISFMIDLIKWHHSFDLYTIYNFPKERLIFPDRLDDNNDD